MIANDDWKGRGKKWSWIILTFSVAEIFQNSITGYEEERF